MWFSTASIITACCSVGVCDLHPPGAADAGMGDVAVTGDLVGGVHDDDALALVAPARGRTSRSMVVLPMPGGPSSRMLRPGLDEVVDDVDGAVHRPADAAGEARRCAPARLRIARDAVQGALDPGAVVIAEVADALDHVLDVRVGRPAPGRGSPRRRQSAPRPRGRGRAPPRAGRRDRPQPPGRRGRPGAGAPRRGVPAPPSRRGRILCARRRLLRSEPKPAASLFARSRSAGGGRPGTGLHRSSPASGAAISHSSG